MSLKDALKSISEINDLDMNNPGAWPGPVKVLAGALLLIAVLVGGYFLHVQDMQEELARQAREEGTLKEQFESKVRQAANLDAYKDQMVLMEASFEQLLRQLPSDTEVPGLLEDITSAGLNSGLEFEEIRLLSEVAQQFYIELPIQIRVLGTYHELATFVSAVASMPRIVTLHDFAIEPDKDVSSGGRLAMNIQVKTYRYKDQGQG